MTAVPKEPPMARAEKARPVAVERKAWGAVYWIHATRRVKGPAQPMPVRAVKTIWRVPHVGFIKAKQMDAISIIVKVTAKGVSEGFV